MNIYARTLSALKPHLRQLVTASTSAALHAIMAGVLLWMIGPLMMTLFEVSSLPIIGAESGAIESQTVQTESPVDVAPALVAESWIATIKETIKGWISSAVAGTDRTETLFNFCILILGVSLLKNVFYYIQGFFMVWVQQSIMLDFRNRLFEKYQRLSLGYFHSRRTGEVISRVTNDVVVLNDSIDIGFNRLVTDVVTVIVLALSLIILSWELTLMAAIVLPIVFGFIYYIGRKMRKYSERAQQKMADVNSVLEEAVNNVRIVKAFSMEKFETNKFKTTTRNYFLSLVRMVRIRHLSSPINDILATIAGISIVYYAGTKIMSGLGSLDVGDFMTFILVMFTMIKPVKSLSQIHVKLQEGMAAAERIFEVLDAREKIVEQPGAREIGAFDESIEFDRVCFSYKDDVPVLTEVSFTVRRGEVIAIVGPSGAGKSTLLDLLPRFYDPTGGSVRIDGRDLREVSLQSLRGLMGIVTQETYLFNDTIYNNIDYGQNGIGAGKVEEAARMANAQEFITTFPDGFDTRVGNRGIMLSGGQRQRLAIARALLKDPRILIFDEATSALDTESEALVQQAIDRLMSNRTALVVAHRLSTVKNADRILVLEAGRIVEEGSHDQLIESDGLYRRLYNMQFRNGR